MKEFRLRNDELADEKARVYELEAELIRKINIVEQYSVKQPYLAKTKENRISSP